MIQLRRTAMSYDRLMQVVTEQAMQRAMVRTNRRKYGTRRGMVPDARLSLAPDGADPLVGV